jgi:hypothetical protein
MLLGDGYINEQKDDQHRLVLTSKSKRFLNYVSSEWQWLFCDPYEYNSNPNTYYRTHTVSHPFFTDMYSRWYPDGEKQFPDDLELNPTQLKYWYAGDGTLSTQNKRPFARISTSNESHRAEWLISLLPTNATYSGNYINIPTEETNEFLEWIGDPLPGYEYKWNETLNYDDCQQ